MSRAESQAPAAEPRKPRWRVWLRRSIKVTIWSILALLALVGIVVALLHTDWGREKVRQRVEAELDDVFAGDVSIGSLEGSLLSSFTLREISINDRQGRRAVSLGRLSVDYRLISLPKKVVRIRRLLIDDLAVGAHVDADGKLNLAGLLAEEKDSDEEEEEEEDGGGESEWRVVVERVVVRGGASLHGKAELLEELTELVLAAEVRFEDGALAVELAGLTGKWNNRDLGIDAAGQLRIAPEATTVEGLHLALGDARVDVPHAAFSSSALRRAQLEARIPARVAHALDSELGLLADVAISVDGAREHAEQPFAAKVRLSAGRAELAGTVTLEENAPRATAVLALTGTDLASAWRGLPATALAGEIDAEASGTSLADLVGRVTVLVDGSVEETAFTGLRLAGSIADQVLDAELTGSPEGGHLEANAEVELDPDIVVRSSRAVFRHRKIQALVARYADVTGAVGLTATAKGPLDALRVEGKATGKAWAAYGSTGREAVIDFDLVRSGEAADGSIHVSAVGIVNAGTPLGQLDLDATSSNGGRRAVVSVRSVGHKAAHEIEVDGVLVRGKQGVRAELERSRIATRGLSWRGGPATITLRANHTLRVDGLHLRSTAGNIDVDGDFALRGASRGTLEVNARDIRLADIGRALQLTEPLHGTATVSGTLQLRGRRSQGRVSLTASRAAYGRDVPTTTGQLDIDLANQDLTLEGTFATEGVGRLTVHALGNGPRNPLDLASWARLDERSLRESKVSGRVEALAKIAHLHPELPRSGRATFIAELGEGAAAATFEIDARELGHHRLDEPGTVEITGTIDGRTLVANASATVRKRGSASASASLELPGHWTRAATWRRVDERAIAGAKASANLPSIDWWAEQLDLADQPIGATGKITVDVEPAAEVAVAQVVITQPKGGPRSRAHRTRTEAKLEIREHHTEVELSGMVRRRKHLTANAKLAAGWRDALSAPERVEAARLEATVELDALPLTALHQTISSTPLARKQTLRGNLDGLVTASGSLAAPHLEAKVDTRNAEILGSRFRALVATGSYRDGAITTKVNGAQRHGGTLELTGATDVSKADENAPLTAALTAVGLDLGFVRMVAPDLGVAGKLDARFAVGGTRAKPTATGTATWRDGRVMPGEPLFELSDMVVKVNLAKTKLTARGSGASGRGKLAFRALVGLRELAPTSVDLTVEAEAIPIETTTMLLAVDTSTRVHGRQRGRDWNLVADVGETIVHLPSDEVDEQHPSWLPDDLVFVDQRAGGSGAKSRSLDVPAPSSLVSLHVRAPDTIEIRGQQAGAVAAVDLRVEMRDELTMIGTARTQRGWISLFGRRYELRRGLVSYEDTTDPVLDIEIAHEFSAMTLIIDVTGTGEEPIVKLRAEPARYDESELLAFVLGASPDDPRPNEETAGGRAKGIASSMLANRMQDMVSDIVPIDVLRIDMSDEQATAEKLTVGKWLTRKLFLAYRHRFSAAPDENSGEATIEYRFWRRWLLEAFYGDRGVGGADVLWIKRY